MAQGFVAGALAAAALVGAAGVLPGPDLVSVFLPASPFAWAVGSAEAAAVEPVRIGVVDMQSVIVQSTKGQRAQAALKVETEAKQKDMNAREEEVRKLQAELERQKAVLSAAALREKEESIQRRVREIRRLAEDGNRDLQKREAELVGEIQREILQVVTEYGKEKGFSLIIERGTGAVWYVNERTDLTKDIIDRYNAKATK